MEYLGIEHFGTLYVDSKIVDIPTRPWQTNSYPFDLSNKGRGNIAQISGSSMSSCELKPNANGQVLTWIVVVDGDKAYYICDRVMLTGMNWYDLQRAGLVDGKLITLNDKQYTLTMMTGGKSEQDKNNLWAKVIANTENITGLSIPTAKDLEPIGYGSDYASFEGQHNQLWHWWGVQTYCKETVETATNSERGYASAVRWSSTGSQQSSGTAGWRPVLVGEKPIAPPDRPLIIKPKASSSESYVNETNSVVVETQYKGNDSPFKEMKITVNKYDSGETVQNISTPTLTTGITDLKPQTRYQLVIRHVNQAGLISGPVYSYIILGKYGKYKLSEPVTGTQFSKVTSYGEPQKLEMKPQSFPETESSKVRLVPHTMNKLTVEEAVTDKSILKVKEPTKTIAVGDKLSIQKEPRSILGIEQLDKFQYSTKVISSNTIKSPNYSFGVTQGNNTTVNNNNMYTVFSDEDGVKIMELNLKTLATKQIFAINSSSKYIDTCITSEGNHMFVVLCTQKNCTVYHFVGYANNASTKEYTIPVTKDCNFEGVDIAMDLATSTVAITYKEVTTTGSSANLYAREYKILSDGTIELSLIEPLISNAVPSSLSLSYIAKYKRDGATLYGIFYTHKGANTLLTEHNEWVAGTKSSASKAGNSISGTFNDSVKTSLFSYEHNGTYYIEQLIHVNTSGGSSFIFAQTYNVNTSAWNTSTIRTLQTQKVYDLEFNYSQDGTVYAMWSEDTSLYGCSKDSPSGTWTSAIFGNIILRTRNEQKLFTSVYSYSKKFGICPACLVLDYDSTKGDQIRYESWYRDSIAELYKLTLDSPVTAKSGEKIYFMDYDLEVKAGEKQAETKLDEITPEYYQYNANFTDKEEARDITIKGRNTRLTTLYYYNY